MKKILCIVLLFALMFSCVACGQVSFNGNFKAATEETYKAVQQQIPSSPVDGEAKKEIAKGYQMTANANAPDQKLMMSYNIKFILGAELKDSKMSLDYNMSADGMGELKYSAYFSNMTQYLNLEKANMKGLSITGKFKSTLKIGQDPTEVVTTQPKLEYAFDAYDELAKSLSDLKKAGITVEIATRGNTTKIKLIYSRNSELTEDLDENITDFNAYYIYVIRDGLLVGSKFDMSYKINGVLSTMNFEVKPYSGDITLPSDLDTYKENKFPF
ncbi:MAG: hypothetical protein RR248_04240 [Clostridia bacterium]